MGAGYSQGDINQYWSTVETPGNANLLEVGNDGKLKVYELNGNGNCHPLPGMINLSTRVKEVPQKRIFITVPGDKRNLRLYVDNECDTRANEEAYIKKTSLNNQNILYFPANSQQNAGYYKINDTEPNKPPLPFFMVTPDENSRRRFASERAISDCRPIPYVNSSEDYGATPTKPAAFQRQLSHLTLYTDADCTNIYDQTKEEIDRVDNSYLPYSITTNPYNVVTGYGGRVMENSKARYYKIKNEKWNVINDTNPDKLAAETARRAEIARLKEEREERERQEAIQRQLIEEKQARERELQEKIRIQAASEAAAAARAKAARDAAERARVSKAQADLAGQLQRQRARDLEIQRQRAREQELQRQRAREQELLSQRARDAFVRTLNKPQNTTQDPNQVILNWQQSVFGKRNLPEVKMSWQDRLFGRR
jgi:hypothetical protein